MNAWSWIVVIWAGVYRVCGFWRVPVASVRGSSPQRQGKGQHMTDQQQPTPPPRSSGWTWKVWTTLAVVAFISWAIGLGMGAATDSTTTSTEPTVTTTETKTIRPPAKTVTAHPPTPSVTHTVQVTATTNPTVGIPGDGTWLVGKDIQPGTYRASGHWHCYWARLRGLSGQFGDIISNGNGANPVVTVEASDVAFQTQLCGEWTRVT
jgi:hypothetical protein